ncbi:hypothetical protein BDW74DRAFT_173438 [Aspergillus multicolor]|uniref:uncharacterized protein n=1 Tax=Aspergillus multicolor TaxID=41759 RepID=UPI003CCDFCCD
MPVYDSSDLVSYSQTSSGPDQNVEADLPKHPQPPMTTNTSQSKPHLEYYSSENEKQHTTEPDHKTQPLPYPAPEKDPGTWELCMTTGFLVCAIFEKEQSLDLDLPPTYASSDDEADVEMGLLASHFGHEFRGRGPVPPGVRFQDYNNPAVAWRYICPLVGMFVLLFCVLVVVPVLEMSKPFSEGELKPAIKM